MPRLRDRVLYLFILEIVAMTVSPHGQTPRLDIYRGENNPVEYIQRHEVYLLGRTNDNNNFAFLFPVTFVASPIIGSLDSLMLQLSLVGGTWKSVSLCSRRKGNTSWGVSASRPVQADKWWEFGKLLHSFQHRTGKHRPGHHRWGKQPHIYEGAET